MSNQLIYIIMGVTVGAFLLILIAYLIIRKKMQKRLEIINIDDEYNTRKDASKILTKALAILIPIIIISIIITSSNYLLMFIVLIFELFMIDTLIDGFVDKIDDNLLKQQLQFFSEIRHAYHEFNMVEEAIYQVSQDDELDVSRQGEKIYEILISDDPETELEKYYDVAPNSYLKEFAGISYLTKEFGDRKVDGASLYLKNVDNITQELQLEILKRDKLNYVFQSLSFISIAPVVLLEPLKNWAISNFSFVKSWYLGKSGMIETRNTENPWQQKLYKNPIIKRFVDLFIPKDGTKERRKLKELMKNAATHLKIEWLYVNRLTYTILVFIVSIFVFAQLHKIAIDYIYTEPSTDYNLISMSDKEEQEAMEITEQDNTFLDRFRGNMDVTKEQLQTAVERSDYYESATEEEIKTAVDRIYEKLQVVNSEYLKWFEILLAFVFAIVGYMAPIWVLYFQAKMRQLEMEDEVMQFQTIILMLMRIERVNVEIILEWLERYEALEEMKEEISYQPLVQIIESLQAAVEKIPIKDAFDELDSERDYYREKRKESNERLISRKAMIGRFIGFAPMVTMFVGYLIIPLVFIGLTSMSSSFSAMSSM